MLFISSLKIFSFSRYLHFCPEFFVYVGKGFDKKAKVNFKTYEVTSLNTSNQLQYTYCQISQKAQAIRQ